MKKFAGLFVKFFVYLSANVILLFFLSYSHLYASVHYGKYLGRYNEIFDIYVCKTDFACLHEQGHSYDAHGAQFTFLTNNWRSTNSDFRATIDSTYECTRSIFDTQDILHTEFPKTSETLMATEILSKRHSDDQWRRYIEIYAQYYAIMKANRWDIYHYDDVEAMAISHLEACLDHLEETTLVNGN